MNDVLIRYIQRQMLTGHSLMSRKSAGPNGRKLPSRTMTVLIQKRVKDFLTNSSTAERWIVVPGLRGVGKTTITAQTYLWIESSVGQKVNQIYISLDEVVERFDSNLADVLDAYQSVLGATFESLKQPTFIFIDEVQSDPNWARTLKFIYDRTDNLFFLCTGSSATHLQMDADVEGRRARIDKLYPLSFPEYQVLTTETLPAKGFKDYLLDALYYSRDAEEVFTKLSTSTTLVNQQWAKYDRNSISKYIKTGTMPFTLNKDPGGVYEALKAMVDKVITTDLQSLRHFTPDSITAMKRLIFILADSGDIVTLDNLAKWVGTSKPQLLNMFDALLKAELLIKVPAHGSNTTATRNPARYHFMSAAIRAAYHDIVGNPSTEAARTGLLLEDIAALHFYREFVTRQKGSLTYYYDKAGGDCDFILKVGNTHQIAVEVGMGKKGTGQVEKTMARVDCRYGIVFSESTLHLHKDKNVVTVPLDYFFLM